MREIKFRGIKTGNQGFRYGNYHKLGEQHFIRTGSMLSSVYEDTIGQYTGLKDKNGKEIYESDLVYLNSQLCLIKEGYHSVDDFQSLDIKVYGYFLESIDDEQQVNLGLALKEYNIIVIGNIYENVELLKGE